MDKNLYENAMDAIRKVFGDTSVPTSTTRENLTSLIDEIQTMIDALPED